MPPIISIVGKSESGKTTIIEKLIAELKTRGFRIGVIKHASHGFDVDREGKDSWRHKTAGADTVIVSSPGKIAMVKDEPVDSLNRLENYFQDMDLVITEGYKNEKKPKIEIFRSERHSAPHCLTDDTLIAFVSDTPINIDVPIFRPREIEKLADFIQKKFL